MFTEQDIKLILELLYNRAKAIEIMLDKFEEDEYKESLTQVQELAEKIKNAAATNWVGFFMI